jgi:LysM repeat protein
MEERRIALPFVKPASLTINTISKPDLFNGSLANNFVAKSLASLFCWHRVCVGESFISDYIEGGGRVMKQRDKIDTLEADFEVDFSDKEGYSARRKNKENRLAGRPPGKSGFSLLIGAVILGLFVLVALLFPRSSNIDSGSKMRSLERRIKQLEERLYRLDWIEAELEQIKEKNKQFNTFIDTFRTLETPSKSSTAQTAEKQTKAVYHEVLAGETLYGISRRHGITVDDLRRLNKLEPEATIYPEQRLLIRPAGNQ